MNGNDKPGPDDLPLVVPNHIRQLVGLTLSERCFLGEVEQLFKKHGEPAYALRTHYAKRLGITDRAVRMLIQSLQAKGVLRVDGRYMQVIEAGVLDPKLQAKRTYKERESLSDKPENLSGPKQESLSQKRKEVPAENVSEAPEKLSPNPENHSAKPEDLSGPSKQEEPEPNQKEQEAAPQRARDLLFDAVAEVVCMDPANKRNATRVAMTKNALQAMGYTPDNVREFGELFALMHPLKQVPRLGDVESLIGLVRNESRKASLRNATRPQAAARKPATPSRSGFNQPGFIHDRAPVDPGVQDFDAGDM